jgi:hypothetical protein
MVKVAQLLNQLKVTFALVAILLFNYNVHCGASSSPYPSFPSIDYSNQSPSWGTHEFSITNEDMVDHELLAKHNIKTHDAVIGMIARRIMNIKTKNYYFGETEISMRRELGDFDELNSLFKGTVFSIPDINKINAGKILFSYLFFWVRNMKCFDVSVQDIIINHQPRGNQEYDLAVHIENLALSCTLDWRQVYF